MIKKEQQKVIRWTARIIALAVVLFGLPFYFGYGNPLPFIKAEYTLWDNLWLTILPLMFIGLLLGWKYEKIGGYLITIPIVVGFLAGFFIEGAMIIHMFIPLIVGILYLITAYREEM